MNEELAKWLEAYDGMEKAKAKVKMATGLYSEFGTKKTVALIEEASAELRDWRTAFGIASDQLACAAREDKDTLLQLTDAEALEMLGDLMSNISERFWCAGWMGGIEETFPVIATEIVRTGQPKDGIEVHEAKQMCALAGRLGHWANLNMEKYTAGGANYIPYQPEWEAPAPKKYPNPLPEDAEMYDGFSTHSED